MAFAIPQQIFPIFNVPADGLINPNLEIGHAVRDLPIEAETPMKILNNQEIQRVQAEHNQAVGQHQIRLERANVQAERAGLEIDGARKKKAFIITGLVACIILVVGIVIAAALMQAWLFSLIAIPFLIGIVPFSYYTHVFCNKVTLLEEAIAAPGRMAPPALRLPVYRMDQDLDLQQSRLNEQNRLAAFGTLKELAYSGKSTEDIIRYALLDRIVMIREEMRPMFYARCLHLFQAQIVIDQKKRDYEREANSEFAKLNNELQQWKREQDRNIQNQEWRLAEEKRLQSEVYAAHHPENRRGPVPSVSALMGRFELDALKRDVGTNYGRRSVEQVHWRQTLLMNIDQAYTAASRQLEQQFIRVKGEAR